MLQLFRTLFVSNYMTPDVPRVYVFGIIFYALLSISASYAAITHTVSVYCTQFNSVTYLEYCEDPAFL